MSEVFDISMLEKLRHHFKEVDRRAWREPHIYIIHPSWISLLRLTPKERYRIDDRGRRFARRREREKLLSILMLLARESKFPYIIHPSQATKFKAIMGAWYGIRVIET